MSSKKPRILFADIETRPAKVFVWQLKKQDISVDQIIEPTGLLCFAAKWLDDPSLIYYDAGGKDSGPKFEKMVRAAHKLLCEADAIVTFNGISFDSPRLNQEFLLLGLTPPPPVTHVDLKTVIMGKFSMVSSRLKFVGPYLGIGKKVENEGWPLWIACLAGDAEAWRKMKEYNIGDVTLLEDLYKKVLAWIDIHPNMNLFSMDAGDVCPNCGSAKHQKRGLYRAATYCYARYQCSSCGKWFRGRSRLKTEAVSNVR